MSSFCKKCGSWMAGESCTVCGNAGANKPDPMSKTHCPGCGKMVDANLAYCPECGKEINVKVVPLGKSAPNWENPKTSRRASTHCPACKALIDITERFCPECGKDVLKTYATCPHCGKRVQDDAEFCPECGGKMKKEIVKEVVNKMMCPNCNGKIEEGMAFCPHCGHNVKGPKKCAGCGKELVDGVKFCPYCGLLSTVNTQSTEPKSQVVPMRKEREISHAHRTLAVLERISAFVWLGVAILQAIIALLMLVAEGPWIGIAAVSVWNFVMTMGSFKRVARILHCEPGIVEEYRKMLPSSIIFIVINAVAGAFIGVVGAVFDIIVRSYAMRNKEELESWKYE